MTDVVDIATRSRMMRGIKGSDTKPELILRSYLHSSGYRFRLHRKDLPGSPDLVLSRHKLVVFVHGCFWHRHPGCFYATTPQSRQEFWEQKFLANVKRDQKACEALDRMGWRVLVVWECGFKHCKDSLSEVLGLIGSGLPYQEWPPSPPRQRNST